MQRTSVLGIALQHKVVPRDRLIVMTVARQSIGQRDHVVQFLLIELQPTSIPFCIRGGAPGLSAPRGLRFRTGLVVGRLLGWLIVPLGILHGARGWVAVPSGAGLPT